MTSKTKKIGILDLSQSKRAKWFVRKYDNQPIEVLSEFGTMVYGKVVPRTITLKDNLSKEKFYIYPFPADVCVPKSWIKKVGEAKK